MKLSTGLFVVGVVMLAGVVIGSATNDDKVTAYLIIGFAVITLTGAFYAKVRGD